MKRLILVTICAALIALVALPASAQEPCGLCTSTPTPTRTPSNTPTASPSRTPTPQGAFLTPQAGNTDIPLGYSTPESVNLPMLNFAPVTSPTRYPTTTGTHVSSINYNGTIMPALGTADALGSPTPFTLPNGTPMDVAAQVQVYTDDSLLLFSYIKGLDPSWLGSLAPIIVAFIVAFIFFVAVKIFLIFLQILAVVVGLVWKILQGIRGLMPI